MTGAGLRPIADLASYTATFLRGQAAARTPLPHGPPVVLLVGVTNRCNLRCDSCFHSATDIPASEQRPRGRMPPSRFREVAEQAAGWVSYLELGLFGEPTLHPELADMVRFASDLGVPTGVVTNGTLLDGAGARALVEAGVSAVSLSVDGADETEFEALRVGASWDRFARAVRSLADARREAGTASPHIVVRGLEPDDEARRARARAFGARLRALGADQVLWAVPHDWTGSLVSLRGSVRSPAVPTRPGLCTYPWVMMAVDWDGTVVPCCADFHAKNRLGNVDESSLKRLWDGPRMERLRAAMRSRDRERLARETGCGGCSMLSQTTLSPRASAQLARQTVSEAWRRTKDAL